MNAASTKFRAEVVVQLLVLILLSLLPFCYANPIPSGLTQAAPGASSMIPQPVSGHSPPPYHTPSHLAQGASVAASVPHSASNNPPLLSEHVEGDSPPPYQQVPDHDPFPFPHPLNKISRKFIVPIFVGDVSFQNDPRLQFRARDFTVSNSITFPDYPPGSDFHAINDSISRQDPVHNPTWIRDMEKYHKLLDVLKDVTELLLYSIPHLTGNYILTPEFQQEVQRAIGEGTVHSVIDTGSKWYPSYDYKRGDEVRMKMTTEYKDRNSRLLLTEHWLVGARWIEKSESCKKYTASMVRDVPGANYPRLLAPKKKWKLWPVM
ncbi:hypothetical protein EV360DRAFT_82795 [Lentinula raphanica]|nr:hypothetical protein EV360DRAFT_82795 [Lentinula raphanica]